MCFWQKIAQVYFLFLRLVYTNGSCIVYNGNPARMLYMQHNSTIGRWDGFCDTNQIN